MVFPIFVLSGIFQLIQINSGQEFSVIRHADGDIFTAEGSCHVLCGELSSGTGTPYARSITSTSAAIPISNGTCLCQCDSALPVFREDLQICVSDIHECSVAGFANNPGIIEKVPYVFLPQRGQIIYPQAEIRFDGVITPVCGIAGAQQLGKAGWLELRNLSNAEPPFRLFRDEGRTFLQWIGESGLKDAAEGKVIVVRLVCRDAAVNSITPGVFIPCIAFRVAGSPSKSNVREVTFAVAAHNLQGLSLLEYIAIGISSAVLAVIYVTSVFLYLNSRKARRKPSKQPPVMISNERDPKGLVNNDPLVVAPSHNESDTIGLNEDDLGEDLAESDGEHGFETQVTSAIIHPYCMYMECPEGPFGTSITSGSIVGERIPEEDVRIVETMENTHQQDASVLPGTQRRKLYFNPAYFERQLLLAPPPAAIEFLSKIREVISIAKHKMDAKRFVPTLSGIPEEENTSERCSSTTNKQRVDSVQGSIEPSRKSQRCTGCPGCTGSKNLPTLTDGGRPMTDDSRVRAWLEDVKPPERRWKDADDSNLNIQDNRTTFTDTLEYREEMPKSDFLQSEDAIFSRKSLQSWKDNLPMLRPFHNIARSEILEEDDRNSACRRSTKSMFEDSSWDRYYRANKSGPSSNDMLTSEDPISAKVRQAIEDSFMKQMEENAILGNQSKVPSPEDELHGKRVTNGTAEKETNQIVVPASTSFSSGRLTKTKKCKASSAPAADLPDMINELPSEMIPPKRIMDAVIREMVDVKAREHFSNIATGMVYEIDSLERTNRKVNRKMTSLNATRQKSPKLAMTNSNYTNKSLNCETPESTNSEIEMRNVQTDREVNEEVRRKNYYNMPELLSQRSESYSLVSEVYVNDGYASPAGSDESGPEIRYEAENPGHLTIKVQDSPKNYVKHDESEYEPDTLDRKPMRLKINGDVIYDRELSSESYVDSLERSSQIFLRSKCSFKDDEYVINSGVSLHRGYGSLREIYEARLRANLKDSNLMSSTRSLNRDVDNTMSWKKNKYLTPNLQQAKRQRNPENQPDVVPLPLDEEIYQRPKPPRRVEYVDYNGEGNDSSRSKNEWDRSHAEAGSPTASDGSPVLRNARRHRVGNSDNEEQFGIDDLSTSFHSEDRQFSHQRNSIGDATKSIPMQSNTFRRTISDSPWKSEFEKKTRRHQQTKTLRQSHSSSNSVDDCKLVCTQSEEGAAAFDQNYDTTHSFLRQATKTDNSMHVPFGDVKRCLPIVKCGTNTGNPLATGKVEDSGYLSSTDSNGSHKHLLRHEFGSVSETDETESVCDGASESGAESVGTDSVFYGNFRGLSEASNFSKSIDSGLDVRVKKLFLKPLGSRKESVPLDRSGAHASDSECESFITVLPASSAS